MTGRIITINEGGELRFQETAANAVGQTQYTATIKLNGDLTANRTLVIGDSDGVVQGLQPGTGWGVTKGGTGLTAIANNVLVAGSGGDTAKTITAPTASNQALLFDGTNIAWSALDFTGVSNTTARNLDANPGVYASQLGTELRFKTFLAGSGISLTNGASNITIGMNQASIAITSAQVSGSFPFSSITGTVPVAQGGTGATTLSSGHLLMGSGTSAVTWIAAPTTAGQRLTWDGTTYAWTVLKDSIPGFIDLPIPETYNLELSFPYNCSVDKFLAQTGSGSLTYQLLVAGVQIASGTATTTLSTTTLSGKTITAGQTVQLALSNVTSVSNFSFSAQTTRS